MAKKLRDGAIEIVAQTPTMFLVSGAKESVARVLGETAGWKITEETTTPPPQTRVKIKRPV